MKAASSNLFLIGPMGAGKSTVGNQLAKQLGREFYDSDQELEARTGVELAWIYSLEGEEGFNRRERLVIDDLTQLKNVVLSTGGGSVIHPDNRHFLSERGIIIYLQTSKPEQFSRTSRNRRNRPQLQVDNLQLQIEKLMRERTPLYEEIADISIPTDGKSVRSVVDQIINTLNRVNASGL